jgi:hypothetical protein
VQMGKVADLVDEHRTAAAAHRRPAVDPRGEHEVVDDQLAAPVEQRNSDTGPYVYANGTSYYAWCSGKVRRKVG